MEKAACASRRSKTVILSKSDLDFKWSNLFLHCNDSEFVKVEALALFSAESDDEYKWLEQNNYEQMRKILQKYERNYHCAESV